MTSLCKNCGTNFEHEQDNLAFYDRIQVPPPKLCWECRMQRRLAFRNERVLYKRTCDLCRKDMLSSYSHDKPYTVYCHECWFSDTWNPLDYGREFDFTRLFFEQFQELMIAVPRMHLYNRNSTNSQFANGVVNSKNVYLGYSTLFSEDVAYSKNIDRSFQILDCLNLKDSQECYENSFGDHNYHCALLDESYNCIDSRFLYDCSGAKNCFMSSNLRGGEHVFRNQKMSKQAYEAALAEIDFTNEAVHQALLQEYAMLRQTSIHRYAQIIRSVSSAGNYLENAKNCHYVFDGYEIENVKYAYRLLATKDAMDVSYTGINCELIYEYITGGTDNYDLKFINHGVQAIRSTEYSDSCGSVSFLFGCAGVRSREYCILNRQYDKEHFIDLKSRIVEHMRKTGEYGEFFPHALAPYAYNETVAQEFYPMTKDQVLAKGWQWKDVEEKQHNVSDGVIVCTHQGNCNESCTKAFRLISSEEEMYRKMKLPLPKLCPNCRHYARLAKMSPLKLYERSCTNCGNHITSSYDQTDARKVYCEQCYQKEIF